MWVGDGVLAVAGGTLLSVIAPSTAPVIEMVLRAVIGGLGGLVTALLVIFIWNIFRTPYRQRNEARAKVEEYEQERDNPDSKYYDQNAEKATIKHWEDLAILCEDVKSRLSLPFSIDQHYLGLQLDKDADGIKAVIFFIDSFESFDYETSPDYIKSNADWGLYDYLQVHLMIEDHDWINKMETLKEAVSNLHNKLHTLSEVASDITNEWQIIVEADWSSDVSVDAGDLSFQVRETIKPMQDDVILAYGTCYKVVELIKIKLSDLAKRRTFKGKCLACP